MSDNIFKRPEEGKEISRTPESPEKLAAIQAQMGEIRVLVQRLIDGQSPTLPGQEYVEAFQRALEEFASYEPENPASLDRLSAISTNLVRYLQESNEKAIPYLLELLDFAEWEKIKAIAPILPNPKEDTPDIEKVRQMFKKAFQISRSFDCVMEKIQSPLYEKICTHHILDFLERKSWKVFGRENFSTLFTHAVINEFGSDDMINHLNSKQEHDLQKIFAAFTNNALKMQEKQQKQEDSDDTFAASPFQLSSAFMQGQTQWVIGHPFFKKSAEPFAASGYAYLDHIMTDNPEMKADPHVDDFLFAFDQQKTLQFLGEHLKKRSARAAAQLTCLVRLNDEEARIVLDIVHAQCKEAISKTNDEDEKVQFEDPSLSILLNLQKPNSHVTQQFFREADGQEFAYWKIQMINFLQSEDLTEVLAQIPDNVLCTYLAANPSLHDALDPLPALFRECPQEVAIHIIKISKGDDRAVGGLSHTYTEGLLSSEEILQAEDAYALRKKLQAKMREDGV